MEFRELIEFAIGEERKAQQLYGRMARKIKDPFGKAILEGLREEEISHEEKLRSLLRSVDLSAPKPRKASPAKTSPGTRTVRD
jgi:rubrerythrin